MSPDALGWLVLFVGGVAVVFTGNWVYAQVAQLEADHRGRRERRGTPKGGAV